MAPNLITFAALMLVGLDVFGLAMGSLSGIDLLSMGWLLTGYRLPIGYLLAGCQLAMGWLLTGYPWTMGLLCPKINNLRVIDYMYVPKGPMAAIKTLDCGVFTRLAGYVPTSVHFKTHILCTKVARGC